MARTRRGPLTQGKRLRRRSDQTYGRANPTIGPSDRPSLRVANRPSELSRNRVYRPLWGDGTLTYFGWPTAHEEDAERAVRGKRCGGNTLWRGAVL
jgi:hypothetical protein